MEREDKQFIQEWLLFSRKKIEEANIPDDVDIFDLPANERDAYLARLPTFGDYCAYASAKDRADEIDMIKFMDSMSNKIPTKEQQALIDENDAYDGYITYEEFKAFQTKQTSPDPTLIRTSEIKAMRSQVQEPIPKKLTWWEEEYIKQVEETN
jgi:hypothetical protein